MLPGVRYLIIAVLTVLFAGSASAASRVALVIGNSAYRHATPLKNPGNDAKDIAAALRRLGFDVVLGQDVDRPGTERAIREFAKKLPGSRVALFYYAGHGLQVNGRNYLAPIDARLSSESDLDFEVVPLHLVLRQMERGKRTNLVFLDACRNNPLARNLARSMGTRSGSIGRGLARIETGVGTMIAFATQPGNVALDGKGRNSPFTTALLRHIEAEGKTISEIMIAVRNDVLKQSNGEQVPWEHSSLTGQFFFKKAAAKAGPLRQEPVAATPPAKRQDGNALELAYWDSVRNSRSAAAFESYLTRFPNGTFAPLARLKIDELKPAKQAALPMAPPQSPPPVTTAPQAVSRHKCDRLASVPFDPRAVDAGLRTLRRLLKPKAKEPAEIGEAAVRACRNAVAQQPDVIRFKYQLAAAHWLQHGVAGGDRVYQPLLQAAEQGYPAAMLSLVDAFRKQGGNANMSKAGQWLQKAIAAYRTEAQAGNPVAMTSLALIFSGEYANLGVRRQPLKATAWLGRAVEGGSELGAFFLISAFTGKPNILQSPKLTFVWLRNLATKGNATAMFATGLLYMAGKGVNQNLIQALSWLNQAANKGSPAAGLMLAAVHDKTGNTQNTAKAADYVLEAFRAQTPFVLLLTEDNKFQLSARTWTEVQRRLAAAGHYDDVPDGVPGPGTRRALFAYATSQ
ncbi:MAG: caspase family protein [Methyloligellaceae bacterium]